jgi:hypothetical protein
MNKYSKLILFNISGIIFLCLLLEFAIRIFVPQIRLAGTSKNLIADSLYNDSPGINSNTSGYSGGVLKKTNQYHSWNYFKPVSTYRKKILFLGDSVTMGICVENDSTFAGILNNELDSTDIINPSLIGYSSKDYYNVFNYFIKKYPAGINFSTVAIFWTLNDIYSNYPDNKSPQYSSNSFLNYIIDFLRNNSKAYIFLKNLFSDRALAYYQYDSGFYTLQNQQFKNSVNNLKHILSICDSLKINFILVLLPYEYQVRKFNQKNIFEPQNTLKISLVHNKVKLIDLREAYKYKTKNSDRFYLYGDGIHFNERGNRLIAEYLRNRL